MTGCEMQNDIPDSHTLYSLNLLSHENFKVTWDLRWDLELGTYQIGIDNRRPKHSLKLDFEPLTDWGNRQKLFLFLQGQEGNSPTATIKLGLINPELTNIPGWTKNNKVITLKPPCTVINHLADKYKQLSENCQCLGLVMLKIMPCLGLTCTTCSGSLACFGPLAPPPASKLAL